MGYTQYWNQERSFTDEEWAKIKIESEAIVLEAGRNNILLGDWLGENEPEIDDLNIALNGVGEESHESFLLEKKMRPNYDSRWSTALNIQKVSGFCKTAQKPYDAVVVSILFKAREIAPNALVVSSDGGIEAIKYMF